MIDPVCESSVRRPPAGKVIGCPSFVQEYVRSGYPETSRTKVSVLPSSSVCLKLTPCMTSVEERLKSCVMSGIYQQDIVVVDNVFLFLFFLLSVYCIFVIVQIRSQSFTVAFIKLVVCFFLIACSPAPEFSHI